jgi:hypothetical protein
MGGVPFVLSGLFGYGPLLSRPRDPARKVPRAPTRPESRSANCSDWSRNCIPDEDLVDARRQAAILRSFEATKTMSQNPELSHRQQKEHEKKELAGSTPPKHNLQSKNPSAWILIGVVLLAAIMLIWVFVLPPLWGMD